MTNDHPRSTPAESAAPAAGPATGPEARTAPRRRRLAPRSRRVLTTLALAVAVLTISAGCNVQEMRMWWDAQGIDSSHMSDDEVKPYADASTTFWTNWLAEQERLSRFDHVLSDGQLYRLRMCESGDNYGAVSHGGSYRGAYQFASTSWDGVAAQHFPEYAGIDPAAARPEVQDAMTRALWSMSGPRPWPVCGYRV